MTFLVRYHNINTISTFYDEIYFIEPIYKNFKWSNINQEMSLLVSKKLLIRS